MKHPKLIRTLVILGFVAAAATLVYFAFVATMPDLWPILKSGDEQQIEQYLRNSDRNAGMFFVALLQMVQVLSVVLPGAPIQIAAGIVYGVWRSFLLCWLSSVAANALVFGLSRKLGSRLDRWLPVERRRSRLDALKRSQSAGYMTVMACLIPVLPNGIIPHIMSRTEIVWWKFTLAMAGGSAFPVFMLCAMGNRILHGDYLLAVLLCAGLFAVVIALYLLQPRLAALVRRLRTLRARPDETGTPPSVL